MPVHRELGYGHSHVPHYLRLIIRATIGFLMVSTVRGTELYEIKTYMKSSTSLTCNSLKFRSRAEAAVACKGDASCQGTLTSAQPNGTRRFAVCSCMNEALYGGLNRDGYDLRLRSTENSVQVRFMNTHGLNRGHC